MDSPWDLITKGAFEAACASADQHYATTRSVLHLRNKVLALLNLSRYADATALAKEIIEITKREADTDFIFQGVGLWLAGQEGAAVKAWQEGISTNFTDAAGGLEIPLLLTFAAVKLNDTDLKEGAIKAIREIASGKKAINWPGPLAHYILGGVNEAELLGAIDERPVLKAKQMCQASFYFALKARMGEDSEGQRRFLTECVEWGARALTKQEYYLAMGELSNDKGENTRQK